MAWTVRPAQHINAVVGARFDIVYSLYRTPYGCHRPREIPCALTVLLLGFWLFLSREVIIANIDVLKRIFKPGKNISPQLFELPLRHKTDLSRVIYANAITMTPGTVSVNINRKTITVHSLSVEAANDLRSGRMAKAIPEDYMDE